MQAGALAPATDLPAAMQADNQSMNCPSAASLGSSCLHKRQMGCHILLFLSAQTSAHFITYLMHWSLSTESHRLFKQIYFLPQLIYETKVIFYWISFDLEGMSKRHSQIRNLRAPELLSWTEMHPLAGQGRGSSTRLKGEETRTCQAQVALSSYFNIYRMLSPLKHKIVLLSWYVQLSYKCRYIHSVWEFFQSFPLFPSKCSRACLHLPLV